jgi:hypothetical protein
MEYTFDKVGNIVRTANTASQKTIIQDYGYDDIDELTSATRRPLSMISSGT